MINYFGYGAMSSSVAMESVIGRVPKGVLGTAQDMKLCIQSLDDLPIATQEILRRKWPANFRSYTITPQEGSVVAGMVWEITAEERKLIEEWELVDTGWYMVMDVRVATQDNKKIEATTEAMGLNQAYSSEADGELYPKFLNSEEDRVRITKEI